MKFLLLAVLTTLGACQDFNSTSNDDERFKQVQLTGSANFEKAYYIIQERCTSCHTSGVHNAWGSYTKETDWISRGYVVKADVDGSRLIFRIINHGSTDSDMPLGMGPLPSDEYNDLKAWVENIP